MSIFQMGLLIDHIKVIKTLFFYILLITLYVESGVAENRPDFSGQASVFGNYAFNSEDRVLLGGRYIPELDQKFYLNENHFFDYEVSANIYGTAVWQSNDDSRTDGDINAYRLWGRYSGNQYELRIGLQKINFGSASILRPLMWFDQIDPRDPLQLTDGVYGALGRYYFLNNSNVWAWVLYGNDELRGWDVVPGYEHLPEYGGRAQVPVLSGELALTAHYRTANAEEIMDSNNYKKVPEYRLALDGKWDAGVGLWFETTWVHRSENLGIFTNKSMYNVGTDYTFGIGNGLNLVLEHLVTAFDEHGFGFSETSHMTAATMAYPVGFNDQISTVLSYNWEIEDGSFFINYEHRFEKLTGYIMAYYNPEYTKAVYEEEQNYDFSGPGIRIMIVYDH